MSRRTIVVFHLPTNELVYVELGDIVGKPIAGENYTLDGARYRVTDVLESIGEFKSDGKQRTGLDKLLELLALRLEGNALTVLSKLRSIGSADQLQPGPGGVIIPSQQLLPDFDHVVLVSLSDMGKRASTTILTQLRTFANGSVGEAYVAESAPHGVDPIRVTDDAASNET
jgi:hypothetical protein